MSDMIDRVPAVVLYARRVPGRRGAIAETLGTAVGAIPRMGETTPQGIGRYLRFLDRNAYTSLSYVNDWLDAFREAPMLDAVCVNIVDLAARRRARRIIRSVPLVVVLHSAAGDSLDLVNDLVDDLCARRGRLLVFFGNEYTLMPQKIAFAQRSGAEFIASQLPPEAASWLYEDCVSARILHAPAALNPARYYPEGCERMVDLGFRGDRYPWTIGDDDRSRILDHFRNHAGEYGLSTDIEFVRVPDSAWRAFLSRCHGIVGAEAGTRFLERDDRTEQAVKGYLAEHPQATFQDVQARFFACHPATVSGKAVSSRHFEAAGTKTCQILLEGRYNGVLEPDVHYLSVSSDLSNVADVVARFRDPGIRAHIAESAYEHVLAHHTYAHRVRDLVSTVLQ